jgi:Leucine-rich repeat (LRR) protein
LTENNLTSLPESIGNISSLVILGLANNNLAEIPESIRNLSNLQTLYLQRNALASLSESIKNLKDNLLRLDLRYNNFSDEEKAKVESWLPNTEISW